MQRGRLVNYKPTPSARDVFKPKVLFAPLTSAADYLRSKMLSKDLIRWELSI